MYYFLSAVQAADAQFWGGGVFRLAAHSENLTPSQMGLSNHL